MEFHAVSNFTPPGTALNGELERTPVGIGIPVELNFGEHEGRECRHVDDRTEKGAFVAPQIGSQSCQCNVNSWREDFAHLALQTKRNAALTVVIGRSTIDDDVRRALLRSHKWERSGRIHGQGRAERHHEIGIHRRLTRALEFYGI